MITSSKNPLIKRIRRLEQKKYRQREKAFFIEGLRMVISAVEAQCEIERLILSPELLTSDLGRQTIRMQEEKGVASEAISAELFRKISSRENPVGIGAIVRIDEYSLDDMLVDERSLFIGLVEIGDPGNLGTVIRTANAVGAVGVIMVGDSVDLYHPSAVKASMGTMFGMPICRLVNGGALLQWANSRGVNTVSSSAKAEKSYWSVKYELPLLLLVGSEKWGLDAELLGRAGAAVRIPMLGQATSLNLAVAAGLILYEIRRSSPLDIM